MFSELKRAANFNIGGALSRWFQNVERIKVANIRMSVEYRSKDRYTELRHLLNKASARLFFEKSLVFGKWASGASEETEQILDGITINSRHMTRMPKTESRMLLKSARRDHREMIGLVDRLRTIAELKKTVRPRSLERWTSGARTLQEKVRLNTMLDLAATRISDIVKGRLRGDW
jgi:hypothetical protein